MKTFKTNGYNYQVTENGLFSLTDAIAIFTAESSNIKANGFIATQKYELTADESDIANQKVHTEINIGDLIKVIDNKSVLNFSADGLMFNRTINNQFSTLAYYDTEQLSFYGSIILTREDDDTLNIAVIGVVGLSE